MTGRYVQLAELRIDPEQRAAYRSALERHIEAALRDEPGVLSLLAASEPDDPDAIRVFEVYQDREAYLAHLQAPHFLAYKAEVETMVRGLRLIPLTPVALGARW
jgi:quinol monooxygenase YgiN